MKVDVSNRHKNSHRADEGKRFDSHKAWLRKRPCLIAKKHECYGKNEAHHVNEAGTRGLGQKVEDYLCVPACVKAHAEIHNRGWRTFQTTYGVDLVEAAKEYARLSPHRHLWENPR